MSEVSVKAPNLRITYLAVATICAIVIFFTLVACESAIKQKSTKASIRSQNKEVTVVSLEQQPSQAHLHALAKNLKISYQFLSNIETDCPDLDKQKVTHCYSAILTLQLNNQNNVAYHRIKDWQLNYSQVYPSYASSSETLNLVHLNGDIHQISPKENFTGFSAGKAHKVKLWVKSTLISESQLMPNYWLSVPNLSPVIVDSTRSGIDTETGLEIQPWVVPFNHLPQQLKSAPNDNNHYANAQWLFNHEPKALPTKDNIDFTVIPTPKSITVTDKTARLDLSKGLAVSFTGDISYPEVAAAFERLAMLGIHESATGIAVNIKLNKNKANEWRSGHYQLTTTKNSININSQDSAGAFYALQSLASLLTLGSKQVPLVHVDDQPHYDYRGQHVDVARNFHSKAFVFALIKQMAAYKLNKLHLHLAEDEGWRLAMPSLPRLTNIGGKRCLDLSDKHCLQPQLGGGDNSRDGFYSVDDYQDILRMASKHHIQVIPSLDMPGHSRAAIKAMEARYHYYMEQENEVEAKRYLLTDFNDTTQYRSIQNYNDNTLNICMESTYAFVDRVLDDLQAMHKEAQHPLRLYHIGADETAGAWLNSPICQALIADNANDLNDAKHLSAHFIERVSQMISARGIAVGGWNDGLQETKTAKMPDDVYSYVWGALPWGAHQQVSEQAYRNWQVVLSTPDVLYFDFPYQIDPKERGYHWASRRVTTRSLFNFMPDNLPIHAEFRLDTLGNNFTVNDQIQRDESGLISHKPLPENFSLAGIQGQLWSETIRSDNQAEYMLYPRLLALAERAWHQANWQVPYNNQGAIYNKSSTIFTERLRQMRDQQWLNFSHAIGVKELPKLDLAGVFYRIPTVGAHIDSSQLEASVALKGLPIEYRYVDEQGNGQGQWQAYEAPVQVSQPLQIRARSTNDKRAGRTLLINKEVE